MCIECPGNKSYDAEYADVVKKQYAENIEGILEIDFLIYDVCDSDCYCWKRQYQCQYIINQIRYNAVIQKWFRISFFSIWPEIVRKATLFRGFAKKRKRSETEWYKSNIPLCGGYCLTGWWGCKISEGYILPSLFFPEWSDRDLPLQMQGQNEYMLYLYFALNLYTTFILISCDPSVFFVRFPKDIS